MKKNNHAFTLVELLVVIVIIGILAGIALPVFNKAQEKGRAISDQSNLRQLGIAIQTYKSDNDNSFFDSADATNPTWQKQLYPTYTSTWKIFKSPFDDRPYSEIVGSEIISYGLNNTDGDRANGKNLFGLDSSKVDFPSNLILLAPALDTTLTKLTYKFKGSATASVFVTAPGGADGKGTHTSRSRINLLFADGHTEDFLYAQYKSPGSGANTDAASKRWKPNFD